MIDSLSYCSWFIENAVSFFYKYPVSTYYDVNALMDLGVEYIKISAPLTFDMETLAKMEAKFRMCPNVAYDSYIPRENGIHGQWVRPEDISYYEDSIYAFDFEDCEDLKKEATLLKVYKRGEWPGNLNLLITNLNYNTDNRGILRTIGEMRSNCKQRCMNGLRCHLCDTAIKFPELAKIYQKNKEETLIDNDEE